MTESVHVLYLEDEPDLVELVRPLLDKEGLRAEMKAVDNCTSFVAALETNTYDIILPDDLLAA